MIFNQLKLTLRQFSRQKGSITINLIGLTIGLATAMLIGKYVINEWYADGFIPAQDRTYRLVRVGEINTEPYDIGVTSAPFATAIETDYAADVQSTTRVLKGSSLVNIGDQQFEEENYLYVDPNFVTFFGLDLLHGDTEKALSEANRVVLTKKLAEKYFGDASQALGKTLRIDNDYDAVVSGVLADLPYQSHLEFDLMQSNQSLYNYGFWSNWWSNSMVTYVRLNNAVSADNFNSRLPDFMEKYFGDDFRQSGNKVGLKIQPVSDVYFANDTRYDPVKHGNRSGVLIFFFAALLLVIIACINYINLSTATAITRAKEMAIHKVLGSGKMAIIKRMLFESSALTAIALVLALQIVFFALPWFSALVDTPLNYELPVWKIALSLLGLGAAVSLVSGFYPGILMASFQPKQILKSSGLSQNNRTGQLRKGLVVFQYALSTVLLCSTFVIHQQLNYLSGKELGFNKDHVLIVRTNNQEIRRQGTSFKNELLREPGIKSISFMNGEPGGFHDATSVNLPALNKTIRMRTAFVDFDYINTFDVEMAKGRALNAELSTDSTQAVLLNERSVKDIGWTIDEALGQTVYISSFDSIPKKVVGVVKDYHFTSLRDKIEPLIISYSGNTRMIAIKMDSERITESIATAESVYTRIAPSFPFNYSFLDEQLDRQYNNEIKQGRLFSFFAGIAIFIACLGIFGLAAFAASTRVKEIGIRKVLGASVLGIVTLLTMDVIKLVSISIVLAIPFAYYFMDSWLAEFAYRININWWVFLLAGLVAISIAFLTVSYQSIKAALAHPANSLRRD